MFPLYDLTSQQGQLEWERIQATPPEVPANVSNSGGATNTTNFYGKPNVIQPTDSRFCVQVMSVAGSLTDSNSFYYCCKYDQWFGKDSPKILCMMRLNAGGRSYVEDDIVWCQSYSTTNSSPYSGDDGYLLVQPLQQVRDSEFVQWQDGPFTSTATGQDILYSGYICTGQFSAQVVPAIFTQQSGPPVGTGLQTMTPFIMTGITTGVVLRIDGQYVQVVSTTATTFDAVFASPSGGVFILGPVVYIQNMRNSVGANNGLYPVQDGDIYLAKPCWLDSCTGSGTALDGINLVVYVWADLPSYCPGTFSAGGSIDLFGAWTDMLVINNYVPGAWLCTWTGDTDCTLSACTGSEGIQIQIITNSGVMGFASSGFLSPALFGIGQTDFPGSHSLVAKAYPGCGNAANPIRFQARVGSGGTFTAASLEGLVNILQVHDGNV